MTNPASTNGMTEEEREARKLETKRRARKRQNELYKMSFVGFGFRDTQDPCEPEMVGVAENRISFNLGEGGRWNTSFKGRAA